MGASLLLKALPGLLLAALPRDQRPEPLELVIELALGGLRLCRRARLRVAKRRDSGATRGRVIHRVGCARG